MSTAPNFGDFDFDDPEFARFIAESDALIDRFTREISERVYRGETVEVTCGGKRLYVVRPTSAGFIIEPA